ncbi:MAG: TIGR03936 family radical SAM-associated protein [Syntrophomonas sp.]|nr:TIGR03936 family radical SAM-associated protein [Syntrophomonas sp.]
MRMRIEYQVGPDHRFMANLDMMHVVERALRRAEIPYHLSEGFNPHIRLSMGTVLPVGIWGEKEYFDLDMDELDRDDFIARMNQALPPGIRINSCRVISSATPALMKSINVSRYAFRFDRGQVGLEAIIEAIMRQTAIVVPSRGKNKNACKDLRPGLYELTLQKDDEGLLLEALVSVNEPLNIRFDEILGMLVSFGVEREVITDFWRRGNYVRRDGRLLSPMVAP